MAYILNTYIDHRRCGYLSTEEKLEKELPEAETESYRIVDVQKAKEIC